MQVESLNIENEMLSHNVQQRVEEYCGESLEGWAGVILLFLDGELSGVAKYNQIEGGSVLDVDIPKYRTGHLGSLLHAIDDHAGKMSYDRIKEIRCMAKPGDAKRLRKARWHYGRQEMIHKLNGEHYELQPVRELVERDDNQALPA